ncbi:hypothetical protein ACFQLX_23580 [Streptomyces polyrhachis]|uniref:Integral membrane protein n=1 Tax=Streptomyces polyrhachis TaxID=1282885 RepID=A0ABW2GN86_9ACTN
MSDVLPSRTSRIAAAAVLTAVEGAVLVGLGAYMLVLLLAGDAGSGRSALFGSLTVLALAAFPLAAARGLWTLRSWSRGPGVITQLMAAPVVWTMIEVGGALLPVGLALGAVALAALVLLLSPSTTRTLGIGPKEA